MTLLVSIDPHNGVPAYRQIVDQVRIQAASAVLPAGTEMPSTRALSAQLRLNPMTVSKAYARLELEGVLERRRGQTLLVAAGSSAGGRHAKLAALKEQLGPAARMARQLQVPAADAAEIFQKLIEESHP